MAKLKDLKLTIGLSKAGLTKLNADLRRVKGNFRRNFGELTGLARQFGAVLVSTVGAGLTAIVKSGAKLQTMEVGFRSIMGGAEGAADMVAKLNKFTAATPFRLEEVSRSARSLLAVGVGANDVQDRLRMLGDIAAASGNSISDIADAFAKVQAKGKVELENLNQLAERGIPIFDQLRKVTGDANMEFGAGAVSVEQYNQALAMMVEKGGFAEDAMKNLSETVDGKLSTALDNVEQALGKLAQRSGILDAITGVLEDATTQIQRMSMSTEDLQKSREDVYDLSVRFRTAHKGNVQQLRDEVKEAERLGYALQGALGEDVAGSHLKGIRALLDRIDEAMAFGTLPDAPTEAPTKPKETLEEFKARMDAAAALREQQEALLELTRQQVVADGDLIVATEGLRAAYGGLRGELEEIEMAPEVFDEEDQDRIALGTKLIKEATIAAQYLGEMTSMIDGMKISTLQLAEAIGQHLANAMRGIVSNSIAAGQSMKKFAREAIKAALAASQAMMIETAVASGKLSGPAAFVVIPALIALGQALVDEAFGDIPMMAQGGLFTGPSLAMVGEGAGTSMMNPEVVAPLDKLQRMMGGGNINVTGIIRGQDILLTNERSALDRNRVRGY